MKTKLKIKTLKTKKLISFIKSKPWLHQQQSLDSSRFISTQNLAGKRRGLGRRPSQTVWISSNSSFSFSFSFSTILCCILSSPPLQKRIASASRLCANWWMHLVVHFRDCYMANNSQQPSGIQVTDFVFNCYNLIDAILRLFDSVITVVVFVNTKSWLYSEYAVNLVDELLVFLKTVP